MPDTLWKCPACRSKTVAPTIEPDGRQTLTCLACLVSWDRPNPLPPRLTPEPRRIERLH